MLIETYLVEYLTYSHIKTLILKYNIIKSNYYLYNHYNYIMSMDGSTTSKKTCWEAFVYLDDRKFNPWDISHSPNKKIYYNYIITNINIKSKR